MSEDSVALEDGFSLMRKASWQKPEVATMPVNECAGYMLARDVHAVEQYPRFSISAVDGFCISYESITRNTPDCGIEIGETIVAGHRISNELDRSRALRIFTGAPIPAGFDTVIKLEDTIVEGSKVFFKLEPARGSNIRSAGEDIGKGELLGKAGDPVTPARMVAMMSAGVHSVQVFKKLKVEVISTGDELLSKDSGIENSTQPLLLNALNGPALEPVKGPVCPDKASAISDAVKLALQRSDIIFITGGSGKGDKDLVNPVLGKMARQVFHGARIKPGRTISLYEFQGKPLFSVSGIPFAAVSSAVLFMDRFLDILNLPLGFHRKVSGYLSRDVKMDSSHCILAGAIYMIRNGLPVIHPVESVSRSGMKNLLGMDSIVCFPPGTGFIPEGTCMEAILLW
ncbi:MAG: molybdopterin molybdotransferase MoeA [Thermoplasmataceae archaeon]